MTAYASPPEKDPSMSDESKMRWTGGWVLSGGTSDIPVIDAHYHIFPRLGPQPQGIPPALRLKFWQYHSREWIDFIRVHCGFLSETEKTAILGGNAVRLFGLERAAPRS